MVDDGSTRDYIAHGAIGEYIKRFNGIVKLYHNEKREGLIRARTIGAKHAQASGRVSVDFSKKISPGPTRNQEESVSFFKFWFSFGLWIPNSHHDLGSS